MADSGDSPRDCKTFTFRLPFPIGVVSGGTFDIWLAQEFEVASPGDQSAFVRMRFWNAPADPVEVWPALLEDALSTFYDVEIGVAADAIPKWGHDQEPVEQWVSLETPDNRLVGDDPDDEGFAFHRALYFLNVFLRAFALAYPSSASRPVTPNDLGFVMGVGSLEPDGQWTFDGPMLMHPENFPLLAVNLIDPDERFTWAMGALSTGHPFLGAADLWKRAERSLQHRGETAECVVNLQTAAEMLLFDLWRMLLVDLEWPSEQINAAIGNELPFKPLVTTTLPGLIGGTWDITAEGTVVGDYWRSLYLLRNAVVHSGYEPARREADAALAAFYRLRDYVSERLYARSRDYPRTLLSRVGLAGLDKRGWLSKRLRGRLEALMLEPMPYYWPADLAHRQQTSESGPSDPAASS